MALTVNLYYTGKNGSAQQFAKEMIDQGVVAAIKAEPGNQPGPKLKCGRFARLILRSGRILCRRKLDCTFDNVENDHRPSA